jgi:hypothetical protein
MKFIYKDDKNKDAQWIWCEKNHAPFIELSKIHDGYVNVFYDITNYPIKLEEISNDIKNMYSSYVEFLMYSDPSIELLKDQYYFFNFIVKNEHAEFLATKLYDYLLVRLNAQQ